MIEKIKIHGKPIIHTKASERYLDVSFAYEDGINWTGLVPIEYRRTGVNLSEPSEINEYLNQVYDHCNPSKVQQWLLEQETFWENRRQEETWRLFEKLKSLEWICVACEYNNPNWARRNQDLKEMGYTITTRLNQFCSVCQKNKRTFLRLIPLPRCGMSGYETFSPALRERMIKVLNNYDAYEGKSVKKETLLPDHKFPEIRWDAETRRDSLGNLSDAEIKRDFQLLSNQRNLQKREVCRSCYQTGIRGFPFGIKFYYQGNEVWPENIPKNGKEAERGCLGCGWYDLQAWRNMINQKLND